MVNVEFSFKKLEKKLELLLKISNKSISKLFFYTCSENRGENSEQLAALFCEKTKFFLTKSSI